MSSFSTRKMLNFRFVLQIVLKRGNSTDSLEIYSRYNRKSLEPNETNYVHLPDYHMLGVTNCLKVYIFFPTVQTHFDLLFDSFQKYDIDTTKLNLGIVHSRFREPLWILESKILFLQELGVERIETIYVENLQRAQKLPVRFFKARTLIPVQTNLARNIFSHLEMSCQELENLSEDLDLRTYTNDCLVYFLGKRLKSLNEKMLRRLVDSRGEGRFRSFRWMKRMLDMLQEELKMTDSFISRNSWLLYLHPDLSASNVEYLKDNIEKFNPVRACTLCPNILSKDIQDLRDVLNVLAKKKITSQMLNYYPAMLDLTPDRLNHRINQLLENPYTGVYKNHPNFLSMVINYHKVAPRVAYLQHKNIKFADLGSLVTHSIPTKLGTNKKVSAVSLKAFLERSFGEASEDLYRALGAHPYNRYVPLMRMSETLTYLSVNFPIETIKRHIYSLLYDKTDIESARLRLSEMEWDDKYLLPMCIFEIEKQFKFTGEGVLSKLESMDKKSVISKQDPEYSTQIDELKNIESQKLEFPVEDYTDSTMESQEIKPTAGVCTGPTDIGNPTMDVETQESESLIIDCADSIEIQDSTRSIEGQKFESCMDLIEVRDLTGDADGQKTESPIIKVCTDSMKIQDSLRGVKSEQSRSLVEELMANSKVETCPNSSHRQEESTRELPEDSPIKEPVPNLAIKESQIIKKPESFFSFVKGYFRK